MVDGLRLAPGADMDLSERSGEKLNAEGGQLTQERAQGHVELRSQRRIEGPVVGSDETKRKNVHRRSLTVERVFDLIHRSPGSGAVGPRAQEECLCFLCWEVG